MTAVTWAVIELWPSHDWAVIAVIELWSCCVWGVTELWPSCDWAVTELWPSLAVTSHRGHRELTVTIFFSWELSDIVLKFGRYLGSSAADVSVKFRSDMHILTPDPVTLRLYETSRKDVFRILKRGPGTCPTKLTIFRLNLKCDQNLECSSLKSA